MNRSLVRTSKFLSLVLRHAPEKIGLTLDEGGWASVEELLRRAAEAGHALDDATLREVVARNDKRRFALSDDGTRIRASQGHSVTVDLGLPAVAPPATLFHGTAHRNLDSIRSRGLVPGRRRHVHLSPDHETARRVGARHGPPAVLVVESRRLHVDGTTFHVSDNGVWLTDHVPVDYIRFPDDGAERADGGR